MLGKNAKIELLRGVPLFAGCTKAELLEVAITAQEREVAAGDVLTLEGRPGREFFVLVEGAVEVTREGEKLAELGPGDWFGEIAILTFKPRTATVTAVEPVRALVVRDRDFRKVVESTPQIALKVLASVAQRLEQDARS